MATPVPKPRTKFSNDGSGTSISSNLTNEKNKECREDKQEESWAEYSNFPASPSAEMLDEVLKKPDKIEEKNGLVPDRPEIPPRPQAKPPNKPPRAILNQIMPESTTEKFGNVLGELKINLGENTKQNVEPIYEQLNNDSDNLSSLSPSQNRVAPPRPPPPPPPPPGWKSEIFEQKNEENSIPPPIPERAASNIDRPLPELPILQSSSTTITNPMYLSLDDFRALSGLQETKISPIPSETTFLAECDKVKEWLSEEEEEGGEIEQSIPHEINIQSIEGTSNNVIHRETSRQYDVEDNPYTPCPRRSDFSASEFVGSLSDPFEATIFPPMPYRSLSVSSKNQNIYVSHQELIKDSFSSTNKRNSPEYADVIETCKPSEIPTTSEEPIHAYVNIGPSSSSNAALIESRVSSVYDESWRSRDLSFLDDGQPQIDGSVVTFVGFVLITNSRKDKRVHCRLKNMKLSFHENEEAEECCMGPYNVKDFVMFRKVAKDSQHSNEIASTSSPSSSSASSMSANIVINIGDKKSILSFLPEDAANVWMFFLSEAWLSLYPELGTVLRDALDLSICGSVWVKKGAIGEWAQSIAGINGNSFYYIQSETRDRIQKLKYCEEMTEIDLRKVVSLKSKTDKIDWCPSVKHKRGPFLVSLNGLTIYIDSRDEGITNHWYEAIDEVLKKPSKKLEEFRLTADDVPVIIDKCIRFVATHGIKSEGIYRRNGKVSEAKLILSKLIEDAIGYHIIEENNETVYAVADVVRQFFRKLDEPLIINEIQEDLFKLATENPSEELWEQYGKVIGKLPKVNLATLKKLISHLKNITENMAENRASIENLAKIFGATLFTTDCSAEKSFSETYNEQINTMIHLINGYDSIFHISYEEQISRQLFKEAEIRYQKARYGAKLMIAIHMWEKENRPFNVKVEMASEEVCREAVAKRGFDAPISSAYALFEILLDGQLVRRLPAFEKLSSTVLRWLDWNLSTGYLLFDHDKYHFNGDDTSSFTGKVKIAESGSKTFKSYEMKIEKGESICVFRNEKLWKKWPLETCLWFIGAENSRKAPNMYNATMISSLKDGYSSRYPGFCISFKEEKDRVRWLNAVNYAQTGGNSESLVYI